MPNNYLDAMYAVARRDFIKLAQATEREILKAYKQAGLELVRKFERSREGSATQAYYASYIISLNNAMNDTITKAGLAGAEIPVEMQKLMLTDVFKGTGIDTEIVANFSRAFGQIPKEAMARIIEGGIYKDGATLSERIWGASFEAGKDIQGVVLKGLAQNTSAVKLAKALEAYVDPAVRRLWDKEKIAEILGDGYAGWNKQIEYNALRLARTTLTHSFQIGHEASCRKNPFVDAIQWHSVLQHQRTCEVCRERHLKVYKLGEVPLDHPNGLCYQTAVISKSMDEIGDEVADWVKGGSNAKLDDWYKGIK